MHIIYHANDIIEAHLLAGMLEAEGIHAFVNGHYLQGGIGDLSPMGFANVMVSDEDVELARPVIEEYDRNKAGTEPSKDAAFPAMIPV